MMKAVMFNPFDMAGRTVVVTGASRGIGRAIAVYASRCAARVIAVARDVARLEETVSQMHGDGHQTVAFDLGSESARIPEWLRETAAKSGGALYGLVHSAGIVFNHPLKVATLPALAEMHGINVDAALMLTKGLRQKGVCDPSGSSLVYLSSAMAFKGKPALAGYAATKGAGFDDQSARPRTGAGENPRELRLPGPGRYRYGRQSR